MNRLTGEKSSLLCRALNGSKPRLTLFPVLNSFALCCVESTVLLGATVVLVNTAVAAIVTVAVCNVLAEEIGMYEGECYLLILRSLCYAVLEIVTVVGFAVELLCVWYCKVAKYHVS